MQDRYHLLASSTSLLCEDHLLLVIIWNLPLFFPRTKAIWHCVSVVEQVRSGVFCDKEREGGTGFLRLLLV